jgi:hypothetical protein
VDFPKASWCLCAGAELVSSPSRCGSEGWDAFVEKLSPGEWDLLSHVAPIRFTGSIGFKPAPESIPPIINPPTVSLNGPGEGLMSPTGAIRIQPTARPPPPPAA